MLRFTAVTAIFCLIICTLFKAVIRAGSLNAQSEKKKKNSKQTNNRPADKLSVKNASCDLLRSQQDFGIDIVLSVCI